MIISFSIFGFTTPGIHRWNRLESAVPTAHTRYRESKYRKRYDHLLAPSESARIRLTCESWHEFEKKFGRSNQPGKGGAYHGAHRTPGGGAPGLAGLGRLGRARVFVSHTWGTLFANTVAAVAHALPDDAYVWLDIFAVRQWPGNGADLSFR